MSVTFADLKKHYPLKDRKQLYDDLGGEWPGLVNDPNYQNTCAIRLSVALKSNNMKIGDTYKEAIEGDGSPLIIKVKTMGKFVSDTFGTSYWGMSKNPGDEIGKDDLPKASGVIVYHADWADATGHFDLWTGSSFVGTGTLGDVADGFALELWKID